MMMNMRVTGIPEAQRKLNPAILGPIVREGLLESGEIVKREISGRAPQFSGRLAKSVSTRLKEGVGPAGIPQSITIRPRAPHAIIVEKGTRRHMPPTDNQSRGGRRFRRWVQRRARYLAFVAPSTAQQGMTKTARRKDRRQQAIDQTAFLIARGIRRRGTRARPFARPGFRASVSQINRVWQRKAQQLGQRMARA